MALDAIGPDRDHLGAFCPHGRVHVAGAQAGPLAGATFTAKDNFDVEGHPTGAGNPTWLADHPTAPDTAWVVRRLLGAGASLVGKAVMDEFAYSLHGQNKHYGSPVNSHAPGRLSGGSSSGSAAAVAGRLADIGLGSDTAGSVRLPAGYCGLFGIRTSHGRVPTRGLVPLAPTFDAVGWMTRDAALLDTVGDVLLPADGSTRTLSRLIVEESAFRLADTDIVQALEPAIPPLGGLFTRTARVSLEDRAHAAWAEAFRVLQGRDVWQTLGDWISRRRPSMALDVSDRLMAAAAVTADQVRAARTVQDAARSWFLDTVGVDGALCLPTAPCIAPRRDAGQGDLDRIRGRVIQLLCLASLSGAPQVTVPLAGPDGIPVGLSLIGPPGSDRALLGLVRMLAAKRLLPTFDEDGRT